MTSLARTNHIAAAALEYRRRGFKPLPLKPGAKAPVSNKWQHEQKGEDDFNADHNIGLQMGRPSGGLVDAEFDNDTMRELAPLFLPPTPAVFGRKSKPSSHWLYRCPALCEAQHGAAISLKDENGNELGSLRIGGGEKGSQSMVPPSIHPSGEPVEWQPGGGPDPADVGAELERLFRLCAIAALLADNWPRENGRRNDLANAVAGWLARCEVPQQEAELVVDAASSRANDDEVTSRRRCVSDTYKKFEQGQAVTGLNTLGQLIDGKAAGALRKVLAIKSRFPDLTKDGAPRPTLANTKVAVGELGVECRYDLFKLRYLVDGHALESYVGEISDPALLRLRELVYEKFRFDPTTETVFTAVRTLANHGRFHPVLDYLDGLVWDGKPRIDKWLTEYGGAEDSEYVRAIGALLLVAAVRRVRQPGCKFDEMVVLESPDQGTNKSSALRTLAVNPEWFTDNLPLGLSPKETIETLSGHWIVEVSELQGIRTKEVERVKGFLSREADRARMSYDRTTTDARRQCVLIGTTNEMEYLRDQTGNRRFWPVLVRRFDLEALERDRDQLWAEAAAREASGASIRLPQELWPVAAMEQEQRTVENPLFQPLASLLGEFRGKVTTENLWRGLGIPVERQAAMYSHLGKAMRELDWSRDKFRIDGSVPVRGYVKGEEPRLLVVCSPPYREEGMQFPGRAEYSTGSSKADDETKEATRPTPRY